MEDYMKNVKNTDLFNAYLNCIEKLLRTDCLGKFNLLKRGLFYIEKDSQQKLTDAICLIEELIKDREKKLDSHNRYCNNCWYCAHEGVEIQQYKERLKELKLCG